MRPEKARLRESICQIPPDEIPQHRRVCRSFRNLLTSQESRVEHVRIGYLDTARMARGEHIKLDLTNRTLPGIDGGQAVDDLVDVDDPLGDDLQPGFLAQFAFSALEDRLIPLEAPAREAPVAAGHAANRWPRLWRVGFDQQHTILLRHNNRGSNAMQHEIPPDRELAGRHNTPVGLSDASLWERRPAGSQRGGSSPMTEVITVDNLRKTYGSTVAVDDVSFTVDEGEIFGILGPNGAGKTTTVECLQGLRVADSGNMRVLGLDPLTETQQLRQKIGAQLQASALPGRIRVAESLELFAAFAPRPVDTEGLLARWRLEELRDQSFESLSGGQRQRLFIALAFVNDPELVFLDELTQGLDPQARHATWELIREIRAAGTTVVLVTHFMDEAEYLCDRLAIIDRGRVIALDSPQQLIDSLGLPVIVRFSTTEDDLGWIEQMDVVDGVDRHREAVEVQGTGPVLALVAAELVSRGIVPLDLRVERPTVEDAFLALTGRAMRG